MEVIRAKFAIIAGGTKCGKDMNGNSRPRGAKWYKETKGVRGDRRANWPKGARRVRETKGARRV